MLLKTIEKHLREQDMAPAQFGRRAMGDPCFVFELRRGREPRAKTVAKVLAYIHGAARTAGASEKGDLRACS